jgi:predicted enzyme related to lactoylglutathione lyase
MIKIGYIVIDCKEPASIAKFWEEVLGAKVTFADETGAMLENPVNLENGDKFPPILFYKNPDAKIIKNRIHFDLTPDDQAAEVLRIEGLGGKRIEIGQSADPATTWVVMADLEGNEFCVLKSPEAAS